MNACLSDFVLVEVAVAEENEVISTDCKNEGLQGGGGKGFL